MFISLVTVLFLSFFGMICAASVKTRLTPNSNSVVEISGDNYYVGLQTGSTIYWSATLSATNPNATVMQNVGNAIVTFEKGIVVHILQNVGDFPSYILLDGTILDGSIYNLAGMVLTEI